MAVSYRFSGIPYGVSASVYAADSAGAPTGSVLATITGTQGGYADTDLDVGDYVATYRYLNETHRVTGDLADPTDVDYARSSSAASGQVADEIRVPDYSFASTGGSWAQVWYVYWPGGPVVFPEQVLGDDSLDFSLNLLSQPATNVSEESTADAFAGAGKADGAWVAEFAYGTDPEPPAGFYALSMDVTAASERSLVSPVLPTGMLFAPPDALAEIRARLDALENP